MLQCNDQYLEKGWLRIDHIQINTLMICRTYVDPEENTHMYPKKFLTLVYVRNIQLISWSLFMPTYSQKDLTGRRFTSKKIYTAMGGGAKGKTKSLEELEPRLTKTQQRGIVTLLICRFHLLGGFSTGNCPLPFVTGYISLWSAVA